MRIRAATQSARPNARVKIFTQRPAGTRVRAHGAGLTRGEGVVVWVECVGGEGGARGGGEVVVICCSRETRRARDCAGGGQRVGGVSR